MSINLQPIKISYEIETKINKSLECLLHLLRVFLKGIFNSVTRNTSKRYFGIIATGTQWALPTTSTVGKRRKGMYVVLVTRNMSIA